MEHSSHGAAPAPTPAPSPTPAPVAQPAPEAPAEGSMEQMDHGNMQGMDMEPEASSCPPEHAAMGHCTPEAEAPNKGASDMGAMDHGAPQPSDRSEEHTSELQSLMRISYAVFGLKKT